jgi:TatD DNase family protein
MLIDTHAHVNFKRFEDDAKDTVQRALDNGVWVVNVGTQLDTSKQAMQMANFFNEGVYAVVGLHPEHTHSQIVDEEDVHFRTRDEAFDYEAYKELAQDKKVVGIGECGLDYYRMPEGVDLEPIKEKQKAAFRLQIKLAKELNKALVIHSRPAKGDESLFDDLIKILDEEGIEGLRFEVHSFTGSPNALKMFLDRGAYVSFNGIITFDKTGNMEKLVQMTPLNKIILETDSPFLTPVPNRGKRNEPSFIKFTAERVAQIKNISIAEIEKLITANAKKLFLI